MVINQGDIFWIELDEPEGSEPCYRHPHVVVQNNLFNRSLIGTVLVCPLTSNLKRANAPGNILLDKKESNLLKQSVVNVSRLFTVNKKQLDEYIGTLRPERIRAIVYGISLVLEPQDID